LLIAFEAIGYAMIQRRAAGGEIETKVPATRSGRPASPPISKMAGR
jgi:hypothetical protein